MTFVEERTEEYRPFRGVVPVASRFGRTVYARRRGIVLTVLILFLLWIGYVVYRFAHDATVQAYQQVPRQEVPRQEVSPVRLPALPGTSICWRDRSLRIADCFRKTYASEKPKLLPRRRCPPPPPCCDFDIPIRECV